MNTVLILTVTYVQLHLDITPPYLAVMKVCEQKFPVIQFSSLLAPLTFSRLMTYIYVVPHR